MATRSTMPEAIKNLCRGVGNGLWWKLLTLAALVAGWRVAADSDLILLLPLLLVATIATRYSDECDDIRAAEERCRLLAETARVFMIQARPDGKILYINRYAEAVTGYRREEIIGRNAIESLAPQRMWEALGDLVVRALQGEPFTGFEAPVRTKAGEECVFLWSMARTEDENGEITGVVASGIDLTDLKRIQDALRESEEKYRDLVDHSVAGVFIVQDAKFVFANRRAEEISGYTIEEVRDMPFWELVHPDDRALMIDRAARRLRGDPVEDRYEYTAITKSGELRRIEIWATRIIYEGKPAILGNVIDITERRRDEDDRLKYERQKHEFLRETISAVTQGKLDVVDHEEARRLLEDAQVTVEIAEPKDVPLARHLVRNLAEGAGLSGERLDQFLLAVGEATVNAIKHGNRGTVYAGLRDGRVWVGVTDRGPGMDTLVLTRVVFGKGFSTKPSLGLGYTFILDGSDHVTLATGTEGTTVVMEKSVTPPPPEPPIGFSQIPSLW